MEIETAWLFRIPSVHVTPTDRNAVLLLNDESLRLVRDELQSSKFHTPAGFTDGRMMSLCLPPSTAPGSGATEDAPGNTCWSGSSRRSAWRSCGSVSSDAQPPAPKSPTCANNTIDSLLFIVLPILR